MPRTKTGPVVRAPKGSVVKLRSLSLSTEAHERLRALVEAMEREEEPRAHASGAVELCLMDPARARQLLSR